MSYRTAARGEIPDGCVADIRDLPGNQAEVLFAPGHGSRRLVAGITRLASHQVVHGSWRQRWTGSNQARRPAQGLMKAVSRWERVPGHMLPSGRVVVCIEEDGSCVMLVDEDACTPQLQNAMNDLHLRLAGDGLWIQCWFNRRPMPTATSPAPVLTMPGSPLAAA
ncbi:hypothetical protein [Streptomyces sp. TRM68416]|uniref:hypothetical protein n=1 Tax=Streptomyces sp. TRM68416 TaxID=2758412 RepID=UPI001661F725|nr:hypothetical protein [Streptomyces sp. TRM68416]MBD0837405.1 hypothetical protein [Streptomyces sp. TRM68416]